MTHVSPSLIHTAPPGGRPSSELPHGTPGAEFHTLLAELAPTTPEEMSSESEQFDEQSGEVQGPADELAEEAAELEIASLAIFGISGSPPKTLASGAGGDNIVITASASASAQTGINLSNLQQTSGVQAAPLQSEGALTEIGAQKVEEQPQTGGTHLRAASDPQSDQLPDAERQILKASTSSERDDTLKRPSSPSSNQIEFKPVQTGLDRTRNAGALPAANAGLFVGSATHEELNEPASYRPTNVPMSRMAEAGQLSPQMTVQPNAPDASVGPNPTFQLFNEETGARAPSELLAPAQASNQSVMDARSVNVTPAPEVRQAAVSLAEGIRAQGAGTTEIHLSPEELGRVRLVVATSEKGTNVTIFAERLETSDFLRRNVEVMHRTCKDMGLGETQISFADRQQPHSEHGQPEPTAAPDHPMQNSPHSELHSQPTHTRVITLDRVDLRL